MSNVPATAGAALLQETMPLRAVWFLAPAFHPGRDHIRQHQPFAQWCSQFLCFWFESVVFLLRRPALLSLPVS